MSEAFDEPWPKNTHRLRIGEVEFDLRYRSVRRDGRVHELSQRCFDLLLLFLREPYLLHTRDEIFRRVWLGAVVEDANISTTIWALRKALGAEAKDWIRTVSKQGYIFDPPMPLEPAPANDSAGPDPVPAETLSVAEVAAAPVEPVRLPRGGRNTAAFVLICCVVAILTLAAFYAPTHHTESGRVVLAVMPDASLAEGARWQSDLLYGWIDWQLRSRPDRIALVDPAVPRSGDDIVVLFSVAMPASKDGLWQVQAHVHRDGRQLDLERAVTAEQLIRAIDEVARETVHALMPDLPAAALPSLTALPSDTAPRLVKGMAAEQRRRWNEATGHYRAVLDATPEFGFARARLAQTLAELGQSNAAKAELARAATWIAQLPPALQPLQRARALAIGQDYLGAAAAYGQLWKHGLSENLDLRLAEATNLRKAGLSRDAQDRMDGILPAAPPLALAWLVERTEVQLANRDMGPARASATEAVELARALGWERERGLATLLLIDTYTFGGHLADESLFAAAIDAFQKADDRLGVLRAQVNLALRRPPDQHPQIAYLDELLAEARAAGNVTVEAEALRRAGLYYVRNGDLAHAQERFDQALTVAETAGDRYLHRLVELHLLRQDSTRGDLHALDRRIRDMSDEELQGATAFWVGLTTARLQFRRGQFDAALKTLDDTEERLRATRARALPQIAVGLSCLRATVLISQGRPADAVIAARTCRSTEMPYFSKLAEISEVEIESLSGGIAAIRPRLSNLVRLVAEEPVKVDRWTLTADTSPLLIRFGEVAQARDLIQAVLPEVQRAGQHLIEADLRTMLAYAALAEGATAEAERQLALADRLAPADDWAGRRNQRIAMIALELAQGRRDAAMRKLAALHEDARARGDVLIEIATHALADTDLQQVCSTERHVRLLGQSGLRGATMDWLVSPPRTRSTSGL